MKAAPLFTRSPAERRPAIVLWTSLLFLLLLPRHQEDIRSKRIAFFVCSRVSQSEKSSALSADLIAICAAEAAAEPSTDGNKWQERHCSHHGGSSNAAESCIQNPSQALQDNARRQAGEMCTHTFHAINVHRGTG